MSRGDHAASKHGGDGKGVQAAPRGCFGFPRMRFTIVFAEDDEETPDQYLIRGSTWSP